MENHASAAEISTGQKINQAMHSSRDVWEFLKNKRESVIVRGTQGPALAYLAVQCFKHTRRSLLFVTATDAEAEGFAETISFFLGVDGDKPRKTSQSRVFCFPSRTTRKSQSLNKSETVARRMETLYALRMGSAPSIVVTSALALMERLPPPEVLEKEVEYRVVGETFDLDAFTRRLIERGYYRVSLVTEYGDFSRRGGILDVFSPLYPWPCRLEFFGDELESVRLFHPTSQRSLGTQEELILIPASEIILNGFALERAKKALLDDVQQENLSPSAANVWLDKLQEGHQFGDFEGVMSVFYENLTSILSYLPPGALIFWSDESIIRKEMSETYWKILQKWNDRTSQQEWLRHPRELFFDTEELEALVSSGPFQHVRAHALSSTAPAGRVFDLATENHHELAISMRSHSNKERLLEPLARHLKNSVEEGFNAFLVCRQKERARRMAELLPAYGLEAQYSDQPFAQESYGSRAVKVLSGSLTKGFDWSAERLTVLAEEEIFGRRHPRRSSGRSPSGLFLNSFEDLRVGDHVVHVDHGIGVYKDLVHLNVRGIESDFLLLGYQDSDRLYVPVEKLQKVQKYLGVEGQDPRLDKLGGKSWEAAKRKAKETTERIAEELLQIFAARSVKEGFRFSLPDDLYHEFEAKFGYEETQDQLHAIEDVLKDMSSPRPMDRLICGDVGYGKTEVALRAAFKAVMDHKQVAMLVPTTILAEQHYQAFKERFEGFPVQVASLSRFKTSTQQKKLVEELSRGTVDVVIGTHRLLQKDVSFKDLGLIIVDEEHRFGVKHKEKLKQFRVSVDVLTLTATPIPRTLHMSLSGIRDLSTIETPPEDRRAIETFVCKYDEFTIKEAIHRELSRKGQVFFVHNHVQSIYQTAAFLSRLVPEARIAVAHGQMKERDLEKVMLDFIQRKIDVLVCTTIIESGLDIPAANTIVINRADKFGLAQIYQLRGRVGRSTEQAYAYLLIPDEHLITRDAQKRLRALLDFSALGAGFKIALNDLQIRGGGTILGASQSGHIAAVGYELYIELLEKAVKELKGEKPHNETVDPEISIPISAFLPDAFIPDNDQRLLGYKRLATAGDEWQVEQLAGEWRDRYGPFPESARNLVLMAKFRLSCKKLGIVKVDAVENSFVIQFENWEKLRAFLPHLEKNRCDHVVDSEGKVKMEIWGKHMPQRVARLKRMLQEYPKNGSDIE